MDGKSKRTKGDLQEFVCELQSCEKSMRGKMEGKGWENNNNPTDQKFAEF